MKKARWIFLLIMTFVFFVACSRGITPTEAANGKAKCGRYLK